MTKKSKNIVLIITTLLLLLVILLFSKTSKSNKFYSPDKQYSVYTKTYVYSEFACALFSTFDCNFFGKIYLYDEIKHTIIGSIYTKNVQSVETISWVTYNNTILFKDSEIEIPKDGFNLPRPFKN